MADERPKCLVSMTEEEAKNFTPATEMEIMEVLARGHAEADAAFPWRGANLGLLYGRLGKPMAEVETGRTSTKDRNESNPPRAVKNEPRYVKEVLLMVHHWYAGNCSLGELMSALRKAVEEDENNRCFNGNHPRDENGVCLIDGGRC